MFGEKRADRELRRYRKNGPAKTTKILIDAITSEGVEGKTLLDIGGGVGAIQHELLKAGAGRSVGVDASPAYLKAAKEESVRLGHADRVRHHEGDFVEIAPSIEPADIVTLDRVVCCYDDVDSLVGQSSARANKLYGLVYPRDNWFLRSAIRVANLFLWLTRCPFRAFVHPSARVEALVAESGLHRRFYRRTALWQVVIFAKEGALSTV
jgi:magnesium-protoporphyrin O-methyltransferase